MADETTSGLDASSTQEPRSTDVRTAARTTPPADPLEQASIVSETIVRRAHAGAMPRTDDSVIPLARDVPNPPAPPTPSQAPDTSIDLSIPRSAKEESLTPPAPLPPAAFPSTSSPPIAPPAAPRAMPRRDISEILAKVPLPERRRFGASSNASFSKQTSQEVSRENMKEVPQQKPPVSPQHDATVTPLHTLKDDLQSVVQEKKISYVRAVALEEEKRHKKGEQSAEMPVQRAHIVSTLIAIVSLVALGLLAVGAVIFVSSQRNADVVSLEGESLMFAEQTVVFPLDGAPFDVRRSLAKVRAGGGLTLGAIMRVVPFVTEMDDSGAPRERAATFPEFLKRMGIQTPEGLTRALSEEFFLGIHTVDENAPVIVVPVLSYEHAFSGMLVWEKTMNKDLAPLFTLVPTLKTDATGLPTERTFEDLLMRNYDTRVLKDDAGVVQLFYAFPTRNILIIAESPYSFTEVLSRLRAERKL